MILDTLSLRTIALSNFTANGAIGTAAATVDVCSSFTIPQTTAGVVLTIPNPTSAPIGTVCKLINTGTAGFVAVSEVVPPGASAQFEWTGSLWTARRADTPRDVRDWCVCNGVADDAPNFLLALTAAAGSAISIPAGVTLNLASLVTYTGAVNIVGDGTIQHTRNGALMVSQPLTALGAITAFNTVALPTGYAGANTTSITFASVPGIVVRGKILLISSDDALAEQPAAFRGELGRVQDVTGNVVTLSGLIELPYVTNPVAHMLDDAPVSIRAKFNNPNYLTENTGNAQPVVYLKGCVAADLYMRCNGSANAALQVLACWNPEIDITSRNARNNHVDASYGYGVNLVGSTAFARVKAMGSNVRHLVTGGAASSAATIDKGVARHNHIHDSLAIDPLSSGFDCHEGMYHTRYTNCVVRKQIGNVDYAAETILFDFSDRGAGTHYIDCSSNGVGGVNIAGAGFNRSAVAGQYTTRVINHVAEVPVFSASVGIQIASALNATVAGYHEIEIIGGNMRRSIVTIGNIAPRVTVDGLDLREQDGAMSLGNSNTIVIRKLSRRRAAGNMPNIIVGPGTTVYVEQYTAEALAFSNNTLFRCTGGAGTATVKIGRIHAPSVYPTDIVNTDGITVLAGSLLGGPVRPILKGTTASRPVPGPFEIGQTYLDTTLAATGKPIWWAGAAWVDNTGTAV